MRALLNHRRVKSALAELGMGQELFAEEVGITDRHVRNLCKKDMDVTISVCHRISIVLDIPINELLILQSRTDE